MLRKLPIVDDIALKAIRCTVNQAIRRGWFVKDEFRDLIHDIVIQLLLKKDCFDPSRSSWSTFCAMVARNFLASEAKRQRSRVPTDSIDVPLDGDASPLANSVEDRHSIGRCFCDTRSDEEWIDLQEDLAHLLDRLPDSLREFCETYLESPTFVDAAQSLGVSRKTVYRRRHVVREFVAEESLHEYRYQGRSR